MKTSSLLSCLAASLLLANAPARAADSGIPRPEHPRPDAYRPNWMNLNGEWQFEIDAAGNGESRGLSSGKNLSNKIIVPFCPESKLSGIGHYDLMKNVWYRRMFTVPATMKGQRVRMHFGGVDFQSWVWVNGKLAGTHIGGNAAFVFDITPFLKDGENEVVIRAFDDTASGRQPTGKQTFTVSEGCVYTRTTGIWQTVWLEAVGSSFVGNFSVVPDPDRSRVMIDATIEGTDPDLTLTAEALVEGKVVGSDSRPASWRGNQLVLDLKEKHLWEPGAPFLYDLKFTLRSGDKVLDELTGYFGLRDVKINGRSILINGKRVFQRLILDQGFYPDGVWTAPTDEALKQDIEMSMAAGYNGARLHQKVFEPRFLYWADKLGYLVWGEYSNWGFNNEPENYSNVINEWTEILMRDRNHPAIIGWCPSNETPGKAGELQQLIVRETWAIDPTRPVYETSGWTHTMANAELRDDHDYNQDPVTFRQRWMNFFSNSEGPALPVRYGQTKSREIGVPFMVSEFGGASWGAKEAGWGYGNGPKTEQEFYQRYEGLLGALLDNPDMFGFCYTQLTDVEQEINGLFYYDRRPKFDLKRLHAITSRQAAYEKTGPKTKVPGVKKQTDWKVVVGARADGDLCKPFRYSTARPSEDWVSAGFDDSAWSNGRPPFGTDNNPATRWDTPDIWLRQDFEWTGGRPAKAALVILHDEDTEVFLNGQKIWSGQNYLTSYAIYPIDEALRKALRPGKNTIAVHTHQRVGGQFIDLAILTAP